MLYKTELKSLLTICPVCGAKYEPKEGSQNTSCPNGCSGQCNGTFSSGLYYWEKNVHLIRASYVACPICGRTDCSDIQTCSDHPDEFGEVFADYFPVHTLADGKVIVITSNHGYKFSDGTEYVPVKVMGKEFIVPNIPISEEFERIELPCGAMASRKSLFLDDDSLNILDALENDASVDLILGSFQLVEAGRNCGFKKLVGYNSTPETRRNRPNEKIVDVQNWAL